MMRELGQIVALLQPQLDNPGSAATPTSPAATDALRARLLHLREALVVADAQEKAVLERCLRKLQILAAAQTDDESNHAKSPGTPSHHHHPPRRGLATGGKKQLERLVGEYLLRRGHFEGQGLLEEEGGGTQQAGGGLFDLDIFLECREVERQLVEGRDCGGALAWCADHTSKLRRLGSPLEFQLHKQQFLELVRRKDRLRALEYASQHLSPTATTMTSSSAGGGGARAAAAAAAGGAGGEAAAGPGLSPEQLLEIQQAMATLALAEPEACSVPEYCRLFSVERWRELGALFAEEARRCYGMTTGNTTLEACLQAGLTALKTPLCRRGGPRERRNSREKDKEEEEVDDDVTMAEDEEEDEGNYNQDCPVCSSTGRALAAGLPLAHFGNSYLTCRCTGEAMDGANPPMVLPNGRVYSQRAIREHLLSVDEGGEVRVTCPRTGDSFAPSEVKNIFVV